LGLDDNQIIDVFALQGLIGLDDPLRFGIHASGELVANKSGSSPELS
jgi:hypothetical protein